MTYKDVYKPPFTTDGVFIYAQGNIMALMSGDCDNNPDKMLERTCQVLNDIVPSRGNVKISYDENEIYLNGDLFLVVRGWGYLIGTGCLHLPVEDALQIQNDFAEWVVGKLRGEKDDTISKKTIK